MERRKKRRRKKIVLSQGEAYCGNLLRELDLNPTSQYSIPLLPKYRFDYHFVYQDREYLLEFDGKQHFEFTRWFHRSPRSFHNKQERDFLKSTVALMSGYHLIRVAYNDLPRCGDFLRDALQGEGRLYLSNNNMYQYLLTTKIPPLWFHQYGQHLLSYFPTFDQPKRRIKIVRKATSCQPL